MREYFIGLMSGTSADGVDAVIAEFEDGRFSRVVATHHHPYPAKLQASLIALGRDAEALLSLSALAQLDVAVSMAYVAAALALLGSQGADAPDIRALGCHGQTIFHDPKVIGSSLQIGDPNKISALLGLPVVADFRRMDIALGGEGAPLVPAFHQAVFANPQPTAVVNIGGIANVTLLPGSGHAVVKGFDCGPGNALMDEWAMRHIGTPYDANGAWSAQGKVQEPLLTAWLGSPYFRQAPPKSTGRAQFNLEWAAACANECLEAYAPVDIQASLCALTARSISASIGNDYLSILVCGGGAYNGCLMKSLSALNPQARVTTTGHVGLPPQWVEAAAFAWLAQERVYGRPGNLTSVTGASRVAVLGSLYG